MADSSQSNVPVFAGDALLNRFFLTPEQKADWNQGKEIVKQFYRTQTSNQSNLNFFRARNARMIETLLWCKGSQDIREFLGYMSISDANKAFVSIDTTQSRLMPQFIGTVVESMAKAKMYPCIRAIDDGSLNQKEKRQFDALYRMHMAHTIADLQNESGVQLEPSDAYVPDDELAAKVYYQLQDRLPKEIRFEELVSNTMDDISFQKILNRKTLYDRVTTNYATLKVEKLGPKDYTIRRCIPTNVIYNFFMNNSGELEINIIGEFTNIKVKDFRSKFGKSKENPNGLDEKTIFKLAGLSAHVNIGTFNYMWNESWAFYTQFNQTRPYDDSNILVLDLAIDFEEDTFFVEKKYDSGNYDIQKKNGVPYQTKGKGGKIIEQPIPDGVSINKRTKNTWMQAVWAPYGDEMLYWGPCDPIIPNYTDSAKSLCPYSINISNNDGEYVPSLAERILSPARDYQLLELKRRQIIALVEPDGFRIDVENIRNIDLGDGNSISWEQVLRIKLQTGLELYSSKGVDPLKNEAPPISAGTQSTNLQKIVELTNSMMAIGNQIRELIGVPRYRDGADVGDRTASSLAEGQNTSSFNVTDFVANDNKALWEDAYYKICLLHWNDVVQSEPESEDDLINTRFKLNMELKSSDYEKQQLEQDIQRYSQVQDAQGHPSISPKDAMMLREIGEGNYKLANWYLAHVFESNQKHAEQAAQKMQAQAQQQAQSQQAQQQQADAAMAQQKLAMEQAMLNMKAAKDQELAVIQMFTAVAGKTGMIDPMFRQILPQLIPNIQLPIQKENETMGQILAGAAGPQQPGNDQQAGAAPSQQPGGQPMPAGPDQQTIPPQQNQMS